jgi:hypothetical protein
MSSAPLKRVLRRAKKAGFESSFVRQALPPWWDDEAAVHPSGLEEAIGYLAARLGIAPASLRAGDQAEFVAPRVAPRFKTKANVEQSDVLPVERVAVRALRMAVRATPAHQFPSLSALELRSVLLAGDPAWVTFERLLDWCWDTGIAVLHLSAKVATGKKMDGLAARYAAAKPGGTDRYGIVLCGNYKAPSRLLFHLAHEVAHVLLGHLPEDGVIVDQAVESKLDDEQEREADEFAWTLLSGNPKFEPYSHPRWNGPQLARHVELESQQLRISPGTLALSHGYRWAMWGAAQKALAQFEGDQDAPLMLRNMLAQRLDWSALSDDDADYLRVLAGLEGRE